MCGCVSDVPQQEQSDLEEKMQDVEDLGDCQMSYYWLRGLIDLGGWIEVEVDRGEVVSYVDT